MFLELWEERHSQLGIEEAVGSRCDLVSWYRPRGRSTDNMVRGCEGQRTSGRSQRLVGALIRGTRDPTVDVVCDGSDVAESR